MATSVHHNTKAQIISKFIDGTSGEAYCDNRLTTEATESGDTVLLAYGWQEIARYDGDTVTVHSGHRGVSKTVTGYINRVLEVVEERGRDLRVTDRSPVHGVPPESVEYIDNYVSFGDHSAVERAAVRSVSAALEHLA